MKIVNKEIRVDLVPLGEFDQLNAETDCKFIN